MTRSAPLLVVALCIACGCGQPPPRATPKTITPAEIFAGIGTPEKNEVTLAFPDRETWDQSVTISYNPAKQSVHISQHLYLSKPASIRSATDVTGKALANVFPNQDPAQIHQTMVHLWMQAEKTDTPTEIYIDGHAITNYVSMNSKEGEQVRAVTILLNVPDRN